ncbi:hypothetical protein G7Y89_g12726 [Cudoniella acicularis]|uniref:Uncharacterized protein n=1 Tax=Cudoniella acicularis TaxID=354080 RepID=A0A8H4VYW3_9HELO|nr:hypothetical protein G7Y89_g12726 [Cudoniella acicularis]
MRGVLKAMADHRRLARLASRSLDALPVRNGQCQRLLDEVFFPPAPSAATAMSACCGAKYLTELSGPAAQFSDGESDTNQQVVELEPKCSEVLSASVDPITTLGSQKSGRLYCSGTRRDVTCLFDISRGMVCELNRSANFFSIQKIAWSNDECYVCYADYLKENIDDAFFHLDSRKLLLCSNSAVAIISVDLQAVVVTREIRDESGKWISHPQNNDRILFIGVQSVTVFAWSALERIESVVLEADSRKYFQIHNTVEAHTSLESHMHRPSSPAINTNLTVDSLAISSSKQRILLKVSNPDRRNFIRLLDITHLDSAVLQSRSNPQKQNTDQQPIIDIELPPELTNHVNKPLSFLAKRHGAGHADILLFLNCNSWVWSWVVSGSQAATTSSSHPIRASHGRTAWKGVEGASHKERRVTGQGGNNQLTPHYCLPGDWG